MSVEREVYISGRWIGHYNDDKDNNFVLHLDQEKRVSELEGSDVNGHTVYTRVNDCNVNLRHLTFCVTTDKKNQECHAGCKDFRGVISIEGSKIVGTYEKNGKTAGTFTMEKRPVLTLHHINTELTGQWTGCYDDDDKKQLTLNFEEADESQKQIGVIGTGNLFGSRIWIILRLIDFFKHRIHVCGVTKVGQNMCEGNCTDFQMTMVPDGMIQGEYKSPDANGTFRLNKTN